MRAARNTGCGNTATIAARSRGRDAPDVKEKQAAAPPAPVNFRDGLRARAFRFAFTRTIQTNQGGRVRRRCPAGIFLAARSKAL
jgi:hypothetical protein